MLQDFEELRRRALSTGDLRGWQRLQRVAIRHGLDIRGRPLPEGARLSIPGADYPLPFKPRSLNFSPTGQWLAMASWTDVQVWNFETREVVWGVEKRINTMPFWDSQGQFYVRQREGEQYLLQRIDLSNADDAPVTLCQSDSYSVFAFSESEPLLAHYSSGDGITVYALEGMTRQCFFPCKNTAVGLGFSRSADIVYWFDHLGMFYTGRIKDGEVIWSRDLGGFFDSRRFINGVNEDSVLIYQSGIIYELDLVKKTHSLWHEFDHEMCEIDMVLSGQREKLILTCPVGITCLDAKTKEIVWEISSRDRECLSRHSKRQLFVQADSNDMLKIHCVETGQSQISGPVKSVNIESLHYYDCNRSLAISSAGSTVQCLNLQSFEASSFEQYKILNVSNTGCLHFTDGSSEFLGTPEKRQRIHKDLEGRILAVGGPAKAPLVATCNSLCQVNEGNLNWLRYTYTLEQYASQLCFSQSGRFYFAAGNTGEGGFSDTDFSRLPCPGVLWDLVEKRKCWYINLSPLRYPPPQAFFSDDEQHIWTYKLDQFSKTKYVHKYDVATGAAQGQWGLRVQIPPEVFAACGAGPLFAWVEKNGEITLRDHQLRELSRFKDPDSEVTALAFSSDGKTLASGSKIGGLTLWDCSPFLQ